MVAICSVELRVRSHHVRGRTLVTGLKAKYSVVREATPSARREETGRSDSSTIRDVFTEAITSIEAALQGSASEGHERRLRVDVEAALRVLETPPDRRAYRSAEDLLAAADILRQINSEAVTGAEPTDLSENLDDYIR